MLTDDEMDDLADCRFCGRMAAVVKQCCRFCHTTLPYRQAPPESRHGNRAVQQAVSQQRDEPGGTDGTDH